MNIAVDVDGVLRDFTGQLTRQYLRDYPTHEGLLLPITEWGIDRFFPIGKEIFDYAFNRRVREIFTEAPAYTGAQGFILALRHLGHAVFFCTTQAPGTEKYTLEWLERNGFDKYEGIIFTGKKRLISCDILLDDGAHNLKAFWGRSIAFDQPWNRTAWDGERVKGYQEFIDKYAREQC